MNFASAPQGHPILDETLTKWRPFQIGPGPGHLSGHKKEGENCQRRRKQHPKNYCCKMLYKLPSPPPSPSWSPNPNPRPRLPATLTPTKLTLTPTNPQLLSSSNIPEQKAATMERTMANNLLQQNGVVKNGGGVKAKRKYKVKHTYAQIYL